MAKTKSKPASFALQGGGSHGAFTWGVLDKMFEDGRVDVAAVSGTSAGAVNAVVAADGLMRDGKDGARISLEKFWRTVSENAVASPIRRSPFDYVTGNWSMNFSPGYQLLNAMTRIFSPYQFNPLNINPLKDLLEDCIDFELVRSCEQMEIFVSATNVETGRVKVFDRGELTSDMVMASACLPMMHHAVEIDGVPYWDGGYVGNPALFPLHSKTEHTDIVVVQINPVERYGAPKTAQEIMNRIDEISFNSSLLKELRAIDFVSRLIEDGRISGEDYKNLRVHIIQNEAALNPLGASSKFNTEWDFLTYLRDIGRETASRWLDENFQHLGKQSSVDIRAMFQGIGAVHIG